MSVIEKIQNIKNGGTEKLSESEITNCLVNLMIAKRRLEYYPFKHVEKLFDSYRCNYEQVEYSIWNLATKIDKMSNDFDIAAPLTLYDGQDYVFEQRKEITLEKFVNMYFNEFVSKYNLENKITNYLKLKKKDKVDFLFMTGIWLILLFTTQDLYLELNKTYDEVLKNIKKYNKKDADTIFLDISKIVKYLNENGGTENLFDCEIMTKLSGYYGYLWVIYIDNKISLEVFSNKSDDQIVLINKLVRDRNDLWLKYAIAGSVSGKSILDYNAIQYIDVKWGIGNIGRFFLSIPIAEGVLWLIFHGIEMSEGLSITILLICTIIVYQIIKKK